MERISLQLCAACNRVSNGSGYMYYGSALCPPLSASRHNVDDPSYNLQAHLIDIMHTYGTLLARGKVSHSARFAGTK